MSRVAHQQAPQGGSTATETTSDSVSTKNQTPETVFDASNQSEPTSASTESLQVQSTQPQSTQPQSTQVQPVPVQLTQATVVLATGGTGGHIYPAIAVAEALQAAGHEVVVIGQKRGLEAQLIPAAGVKFIGVSAGKLDRQRPNPLAIVKVLWGLLGALWHVAKVRPAWVIGFGGFASFPALAAAWLLRRPIALHEANAYPGLVTKLLARVARVVAAADPAVQSRLPKSVSVIAVGLPIRIQRVSKAAARRQLSLPQDALVTLVMGGSQGAKILNNYVPEAYAQLANLGEHVVLHSAGRGREAEVRSTDKNKAYKNYKNKAYRVVPYVDAALAWAAADVAITRAGSSTLAEAAFYGVPLIMVPFAAAAEQHQLHNAHAVEGSGAGIVVEEHQLRASITPLIDAWQRLAEVEHRHHAQQAAIARAYPQAAERLLVALGLTSDNTNPATAENKQAAEASYQQGAAPHGAPHVYGNNPNTSTANIIKSNTSTANTSTANTSTANTSTSNTSTSNITTQETP